MRFRLSTILYVFALLAAGMATFGAWGIVLAGYVVSLWWVGALSRIAARELTIVFCLILAVIIFLSQMLLPTIGAARHSSCVGYLTQLSKAVLRFEEAKGRLPSLKTYHAITGVAHSWRLGVGPGIRGLQLGRSTI